MDSFVWDAGWGWGWCEIKDYILNYILPGDQTFASQRFCGFSEVAETWKFENTLVQYLKQLF